MITFSNVSKRFGTLLALDGLTCSIPEGAISALVGQNGAGKTTCLRLISGLLAPDSGSITVLGLDPQHQGLQLRRQLSYLPDQPFANPHLTGMEHLAFHADAYGQREALKRALALARRYRLSEALARPTRTYSRGMLQRLCLIRTLMIEARAFVLDEPFNSLDPLAVQRLCDDLRAQAAAGQCVLLSSHTLPLLNDLADQLLVLKRGRLVYRGSPTAVNWQTALPAWFDTEEGEDEESEDEGPYDEDEEDQHEDHLQRASSTGEGEAHTAPEER
jgi:ABC-2 type transport system ATP-binding protein